MSDIGILSGPFTTLLILLIFGSPGLAVGAIAGALLWRRHRVWGGLIGGVVGFALCLLILGYFTDNL